MDAMPSAVNRDSLLEDPISFEPFGSVASAPNAPIGLECGHTYSRFTIMDVRFVAAHKLLVVFILMLQRQGMLNVSCAASAAQPAVSSSCVVGTQHNKT